MIVLKHLRHRHHFDGDEKETTNARLKEPHYYDRLSWFKIIARECDLGASEVKPLLVIL